MTNATQYTTIVESFLEKVAAYLQQFDCEIGKVTPKGIVHHFDYKLPFKENPKKVRDLDLATLGDTIRHHEFSQENVRVFVTTKTRMTSYKYSLFNNQQNDSTTLL
jgi:hypothetical protein